MILLPAPPCVFAGLYLRGLQGRLDPRRLTVRPYRAALLGYLVAALLFTLLLAASRTHTQRAGCLHRQQQE